MSKDNGFILYACPICEVLLIQIEEKSLTYRNSVMDNEGVYVVDSIMDEVFDQYVCPECNTGSEHPDECGNILKPIHFQRVETARIIYELDTEISNNSNHPTYGIPLDKKELKAIIMEDSIGN